MCREDGRKYRGQTGGRSVCDGVKEEMRDGW